MDYTKTSFIVVFPFVLLINNLIPSGALSQLIEDPVIEDPRLDPIERPRIGIPPIIEPPVPLPEFLPQQEITVWLDSLRLFGNTTDQDDETLFGLGDNERDEVYFTGAAVWTNFNERMEIVGGTAPLFIDAKAIARTPDEQRTIDYFPVEPPWLMSIEGIPIFQGIINPEETLTFSIVFGEQDNAQIVGINESIKSIVEAVVALFTDTGELYNEILEILFSIPATIGRDGDEVIGEITFSIEYNSIGNGIVVSEIRSLSELGDLYPNRSPGHVEIYKIIEGGGATYEAKFIVFNHSTNGGTILDYFYFGDAYRDFASNSVPRCTVECLIDKKCISYAFQANRCRLHAGRMPVGQFASGATSGTKQLEILEFTGDGCGRDEIVIDTNRTGLDEDVVIERGEWTRFPYNEDAWVDNHQFVWACRNSGGASDDEETTCPLETTHVRAYRVGSAVQWACERWALE